jgi:hypothetical protein
MPTRLPTTLHVYPFSRLVNARPSRWEKMLAEMEADRDRAYVYYQPMREAVVRLCASGGQDRERIVAKLASDAGRIRPGRGQDPVRDNLKAFDAFTQFFLPRIGSFKRSLLRQDQEGGIDFEGIRITGLPHFIAEDRRGHLRYVFLYPSAWDKDDLNAYLQVLAEIIRVRFDAKPASMWCMNLRTGKTHRWRSGIQTRNRCVEAARHYRRLAG